MELRFANQTEITEWNSHILANPDGGNVFQGDEFAEQKKLTGWTPRYVMAGELAVAIHEKSVFGLGKLWYIPKGPGVKSIVELGNLLPALQTFAAANDVFAVKVEPEIEKSEEATKALRELGLTSVTPIQPNFSTVLVDISDDLETVMTNLNQKGRHAIRRAERDGVVVKEVEANETNCRVFYRLLADTAEAQGFAIRSYEYYLKFWQRYALARLGQLFFAYVDGKIVAGAYALVYGEKSTYKDGASTRERTVYGASHLLQWRVIEWAKRQGSKIHDLCGAPPSDRINDATHPHYGIGRFKTSFNKHVTDYIGAYDLIVNPSKYSLWTKYGERLAKRLWWKKHHESWY